MSAHTIIAEHKGLIEQTRLRIHRDCKEALHPGAQVVEATDRSRSIVAREAIAGGAVVYDGLPFLSWRVAGDTSLGQLFGLIALEAADARDMAWLLERAGQLAPRTEAHMSHVIARMYGCSADDAGKLMNDEKHMLKAHMFVNGVSGADGPAGADADGPEVAEGAEGAGVRLLFGAASFFNHSCVPNAYAEVGADNRMVVRAASAIAKDEEITFCYWMVNDICVADSAARRAQFTRDRGFFTCECVACNGLSSVLPRDCFESEEQPPHCRNCGRIDEPAVACPRCPEKIYCAAACRDEHSASLHRHACGTGSTNYTGPAATFAPSPTPFPLIPLIPPIPPPSSSSSSPHSAPLAASSLPPSALSPHLPSDLASALPLL